MEQFAISIKWVDPSGNGIITTFLYKGSETVAIRKANLGFKKYCKKLYGHYNSEDMEIINYSVDRVKSGFFSERSWKVR